MQVQENRQFTAEYYAANKRYIGNAVQVFFRDGSSTTRVAVDFPIGHRNRRREAVPLLLRKFETSVDAHFETRQAESIKAVFADRARLEAMPVDAFMSALQFQQFAQGEVA